MVLMDVAAAAGRKQALLDALRGRVIAACVGPVTAEAFEQWGIPVIQPARFRLGALVREIAVQLPARRHGIRLDVGGRQLVLSEAEVALDGLAVRLTPAPYAVLRALARQPGRILSRRELLSELPSGYAASEHAVEAAVARLRTAVGADLVRDGRQTWLPPGCGDSGMMPTLVAVAHGTRDPAGPEAVANLLDQVRRRLPGVDIITAWVELVSPGLDEVMSGMERPTVVVPLFLSTGYHVNLDVPGGCRTVAGAGPRMLRRLVRTAI
jgi:sirohydrochlorin ferrochelatase